MELSGIGFLGIANLLGSIGVMAIQLAGVVVSVILMRERARGALYALIGFSVLLFDVVFRWLVNTVVLQGVQRLVQNISLVTVVTALSCITTLLTGLGLALIILGFWQMAMDRKAPSTPDSASV